jgi:hypothetical protein
MSEHKIIPIISVVYKSKDGLWRGFTAPFDVTCNAETSKEAKERLDILTSLYMDGLKKHNYPKYLFTKDLSDSEDKQIFKEEVTFKFKFR